MRSKIVQGNATDNLSTASFASETARLIGKDERTIRRDAERGEKVSTEALDIVRGTRLDTGIYLDRLKRLPANEQAESARRDLAHPVPVPVIQARRPACTSEAVARRVVYRLHDGR